MEISPNVPQSYSFPVLPDPLPTLVNSPKIKEEKNTISYSCCSYTNWSTFKLPLAQSSSGVTITQQLLVPSKPESVEGTDGALPDILGLEGGVTKIYSHLSEFLYIELELSNMGVGNSVLMPFPLLGVSFLPFINLYFLWFKKYDWCIFYCG